MSVMENAANGGATVRGAARRINVANALGDKFTLREKALRGNVLRATFLGPQDTEPGFAGGRLQRGPRVPTDVDDTVVGAVAGGDAMHVCIWDRGPMPGGERFSPTGRIWGVDEVTMIGTP